MKMSNNESLRVKIVTFFYLKLTAVMYLLSFLRTKAPFAYTRTHHYITYNGNTASMFLKEI